MDDLVEVVLGFVGGGLSDVVAEEYFEGFGEFAGDVVVVVDEDPLEEGLVELAAEFVGGVAVGGFAVLYEGEGSGQVGFGGVEVVVDGSESAFGGADLGADAGLFGLEQIEWDGVGVVGVEELLAFVAQLGDSAGLSASFGIGVAAELEDFLEDVVPYLVGLHWSETHAPVDGDDRVFGVFDSDGLLGAGVALLLAADADEVRVDGAVAVLGVADQEPAAAGAAVDGALEVVRVIALLLTGEVVGGE